MNFGFLMVLFVGMVLGTPIFADVSLASRTQNSFIDTSDDIQKLAVRLDGSMLSPV